MASPALLPFRRSMAWLVLTGLVIAVGILCWRMLDTGYKLKS